jgi:hypothetical protein
MRFRRMLLVLGVATTLIVGVASASSAVVPRSPSLSFFFNQPEPQQHVRLDLKVCVAHAARGWIVRLQEAQGWGHVWRTVEDFGSPLATGCVEVGMSSGAMGLKPFRAQLLDGRALRRQTPVKNLEVFGVIPGSAFFAQPDSPYLNTYWKAVSANNHVYATLGYLASGASSFSGATNTCKWVTLTLVSTDSDAGDPHSGGTSTFEIKQYSLDERSVTFPDNRLQRWRVGLDGSIFQLAYSNSNRYSSAYVLSNGTTADCFSPTGF